MQTPSQPSLRDSLRQHLRSNLKARGFDQAVRDRVLEVPSDWQVLSSIVEDLLRGVQEELEADDRCKERKHFHRAWVRGFVTACAERGMPASEVLVPLAHLALLVSYDEGIMLRVFAGSLGHGIGQAWALTSDEAQRPIWLAALREGLQQGLRTLASENPDPDPELVAPEARILAAAESGMNTGAFFGFFKRPFQA